MIKFCLALVAVGFGFSAMATEGAADGQAAAQVQAPAAHTKTLTRNYKVNVVRLNIPVGTPGGVAPEWRELLKKHTIAECAKTLAECQANPKAKDCKALDGGVTDVKSKLMVTRLEIICSVGYNDVQ